MRAHKVFGKIKCADCHRVYKLSHCNKHQIWHCKYHHQHPQDPTTTLTNNTGWAIPQ